MRINTKRANITGDLTSKDAAPEIDVHKYDYQLSSTNKIAKRKLSKINYKLYCDYDAELIRGSFAKATRLKQLKTILNLSEFLEKNWPDVTREDIRALLTTIMEYYSRKSGQETNTTYDHKKILRLFVRWVKTGIRERDPNESELDILKDVRMRRVKNQLVREDLLNDDDMLLLSQACGNDVMFKALIWTAYDAGTRPTEILTLRIKDVRQEADGWYITVDGKTGQRPIHLVKSIPYLSQWLNVHPMKGRADWLLWVITTKRYFGRPLSYQMANNKLKGLAKKAGVQKRLFLNLFRHSEVTNTSKFMPEALLKKRHGWSPTSKVPANYQHMVQDDVKRAMQEHYGIKTVEKDEAIDQKCYRCHTSNGLDADLCSVCSEPLSIEKILLNKAKLENDAKPPHISRERVLEALGLSQTDLDSLLNKQK